MAMSKRRASLGFIAALMLTVGMSLQACGGDSETSSATLPKAQFIKRANQICTKALEKRSEALETAYKELPRSKVEDVKPQVSIVEEVVSPMYNEMVEELHAVGLPAEGNEDAEDVMTSFDEAAEHIEEDPKKFLIGGLFTQFNKQVTAYGLSSCVD